jgi:hypothetical protein
MQGADFTLPKQTRRERATGLIQTAIATVAEREDGYGAPERDMARIAQMWSALLGVKVEPHMVPLCMIAVKLSRAAESYKEDNAVDIVGYTQVHEECQAFKREQEGLAA